MKERVLVKYATCRMKILDGPEQSKSQFLLEGLRGETAPKILAMWQALYEIKERSLGG